MRSPQLGVGDRLPPSEARVVTRFLTDHPAWATRFPPGSPVYRIPTEAVELLSHPANGGRTPPLLSAADAGTERAFDQLCSDLGAVGVWGTAPVRYAYLGFPPPPPGSSLPWWDGATAVDRAEVEAGLRRTADAHERLVGVVGRLVTEPEFSRDRDRLRLSWEGLPEHSRPRFPLARTVVPPAGGGGTAGDFPDLLSRFLDRWGLTDLATWELPSPQGPLLPALLPPGAPALPRHGVHLVIPVHYPLQGADALLRQVKEAQRAEARALGLDPSLGGVGHHRGYAQLLRLTHLESAVAARERGPRPRGRVGQFVGAVADHLGVSEPHVVRLRKALSAFRRGRRAEGERLL